MRYLKTHCRLILIILLIGLSPHSLADSKSHGNEQLTAEQRERLEERRKHFESLTPQEQAKIREARKKYKEMPADERRKLKEKWKNMTPEERRQYHKD